MPHSKTLPRNGNVNPNANGVNPNPCNSASAQSSGKSSEHCPDETLHSFVPPPPPHGCSPSQGFTPPHQGCTPPQGCTSPQGCTPSHGCTPPQGCTPHHERPGGSGGGGGGVGGYSMSNDSLAKLTPKGFGSLSGGQRTTPSASNSYASYHQLEKVRSFCSGDSEWCTGSIVVVVSRVGTSHEQFNIIL